MTNEANKTISGSTYLETGTRIACMDLTCRKEIALVNAADAISKYECKSCGLAQYRLDRSDGVSVWRRGSNDFNGWVHGTVPS
jgi:hypothetical protein